MISLNSITELPEQTTLSNGIRVFFRKTSPSGLASIQAWVKTGSIHEEKYLGGGLSHYVEHMVFKATEKYSGEALMQKIQAAGGYVNAYTSFERTVYHVDIPSENAEIAFDTVSQLTLYPKLNDSDAKSERDVILREIDMGADEPDRLLSEAAFATAYRVHPYRIPVIGHREVFEQMDGNALRDYFARRYTTDAIHLVIAGDLEAESAFALAEKYFGEAKRKPSQPALVPQEPQQLARRDVMLHGNVNVLRGNFIWKIPGIAHEDTLALSVLAGILGNGDSALLYRELHEKRELVHEIDVSTWAPGEQGLFWISYIADCGKQPAVEAELRKILCRIANKSVPAKLIEKVARQNIVAIVNSRKTVARAAARLGTESVVLGDLGATKVFVEKIATLAPDDIRHVAQKYFQDARLTVASFDKKSPPTKSNPREIKTAGTLSTTREDFEQFTLKNGIRILLQRDSTFPKVHMRAMMTAGGAFEELRSRGASEILSTLLTMDTEKRSAAATAELIESVGGTFFDFSGTNSLSLSVETLSEDIDVAREILCDALLRPKFTAKNFRIERETQLAALNADMDEITIFAREKLLENFFGKKHFLSTNDYGTAETLSAMTLEDIKKLHKKIVDPRNIVISVSGDFDRDQLLSKLSQALGKMPAGTHAKCAPKNETISGETRGNAEPIFISRKAEQTIVQLAFPCVGFADERMIVADVLNEIFSGMASRLFAEVREKRGLAYFVSASRAGTPREGMFYLYAGTQKENAEKVLEEMRKEIIRTKTGKISKEELDAAKTRLSVARRSAAQSLGSRAEDAGLNSLYGLPINHGNALETRLNALTLDDLTIFANEFFRDESALALIVGPGEK